MHDINLKCKLLIHQVDLKFTHWGSPWMHFAFRALGFGVVLALGDAFAFAAALSLGFEDVFGLIALSRRRGWGQTKKKFGVPSQGIISTIEMFLVLSSFFALSKCAFMFTSSLAHDTKSCWISPRFSGQPSSYRFHFRKTKNHQYKFII